MLTLQKTGSIDNALPLEIVGKSTDIKPTNTNGGFCGKCIGNGSSLFTMDDSEVYMFDYDNDTWIKI